MKQSEVFLDGEGNAWHQRNITAMRKGHNYLMGALRALKIKPKIVMEFGCGTGRGLEEIRREFGSRCFGIDPSKQAIEHGEQDYPELSLAVGTATDYPLYGQYDLIIFGFCLYLVDREDLFYAVGMSDYSLNEGGYIAIHDFDPDLVEVKSYHHKEGVFSYKMDHAKLWLANPAYDLVLKVRVTDEESITILRKNSWERFK